MRNLKIVCYVIGVSQLVLGILYIFAPVQFIEWQGMPSPAAAHNYVYAMLAARFLIYGVGMFNIARDPIKNRVWLDGMIGIQAIDLAAGIYYTSMGVVMMADAFVPMFNAALFIGLMVTFRRHAKASVVNL